MADLGAIARQHLTEQPAVPVPSWAGTFRLQDAHRVDGTISGVVMDDGLARVPGAEVWVLWRENMRPIARGVTDINGEFSIGGLDPSQVEKYSIVIKDVAGGTQYIDAFYPLMTAV